MCAFLMNGLKDSIQRQGGLYKLVINILIKITELRRVSWGREIIVA